MKLKHMPWTNPRTGFTFPDAVWVPANIQIDHPTQTARVAFLAWPSMEHFHAGHGPIEGAVKKYARTGPDYLALRDGPLGQAIIAESHRIAESTKDVPDPAAPEDPARNTGFFDGADDLDSPG